MVILKSILFIQLRNLYNGIGDSMSVFSTSNQILKCIRMSLTNVGCIYIYAIDCQNIFPK